MSVILPPKVRELMGVGAGDLVAIRVYSGRALLERIPIENYAVPKDLPPPLPFSPQPAL